MASIKKFFEKKRQDSKFKKLGQGHRLTETPASSSVASQGRAGAGATAPRPSDGVHQTESQRAAALAAVARMERQNQKANPQWSKTYIKSEAMRQAQAEACGAATPRVGPSQVDLDGHSTLAATGVYFKCPLIGPEVLPKEEMLGRIRAFLYEQLEEEPALTSVLLIFSLNGNLSKVEVCVATLRKYLENIVQNPDDPKYRKIRRSNRAFQERVAPIEGADMFLESAGFEKTSEEGEDYLVLPQEVDTEILETLIDALSTAEPIKPELDRGLRVLQPSRAAESMNLPSDFFALSAEELKVEQKSREEATEKLTQLRTKTMRDRDEILEKRQYKYALIRIRFPDGVLLQGTFSVYERVPAILEFVKENLAEPEVGFKLSSLAGGICFDSNANVEKTLVESKLVPATVLNFTWSVPREILGSALRKDVLALLEDN